VRYFYRTHLETSHLVGLLWTSDRPVAKKPLTNNRQHSQQTDIHAPGGIRTRKSSNLAAVHRRPRDHRDRQSRYYAFKQSAENFRIRYKIISRRSPCYHKILRMCSTCTGHNGDQVLALYKSQETCTK